MSQEDQSRLQAILNFWGVILAATITAVAALWTTARIHEGTHLDLQILALESQVESAKEEARLARAEARRWKAEATSLKQGLGEGMAHGQPNVRPASEISNSASTFSTPAEEADGSATASTRVNDISYEVLGCIGRGRITCSLSITSHVHDRWFHIDPKTSFMIDGSGNQYNGSEAQIAHKSSDYWRELNTLLVSGVTVQAGISFDDVQVGPRRIALLDLSVSSSTNRDHHVQLRNVQWLNR